MLRELGWGFNVIVSEISEEHANGELPEELVGRLSGAKAGDVWRRTGGWVIGADTVVVTEGQILGKPAGFADSVRMIMALQGRAHTVMTGVTAVAPRGNSLTCVEKTEVVFRALTEAEAVAYVQQGESADKAGAYAIQGRGALLVESIKGCYFNVVGLPLQRLSRMLQELGWPLSEQWRFYS